jgi:hypothetical protein
MEPGFPHENAMSTIQWPWLKMGGFLVRLEGALRISIDGFL